MSEHAFEWRYLDWELVDELELLFDRLGVLGDPLFVLIPDGFEAERYDVVTTSPFDFYPSVEGILIRGRRGRWCLVQFNQNNSNCIRITSH